MRLAPRLALVVIASLIMQGCISAKTYVDPAYGKAKYTDIKPVAAKYGLDLKVQFQRNGENLDKVNGEVQKAAERAVRATGVFDLDSAVKANTLNVTINNVADMSTAVAKGFGTGLTFGLVGSTVTDAYEISIQYTDEKGVSTARVYMHALHTTVGNKKAPIEGVAPTSPADGFATIIEETILNFLKDMQDSGKLVRRVTAPAHVGWRLAAN